MKSSRSSTACTGPCLAAVCRGVHPSCCCTLGSAPKPSRSCPNHDSQPANRMSRHTRTPRGPGQYATPSEPWPAVGNRRSSSTGGQTGRRPAAVALHACPPSLPGACRAWPASPDAWRHCRCHPAHTAPVSHAVRHARPCFQPIKPQGSSSSSSSSPWWVCLPCLPASVLLLPPHLAPVAPQPVKRVLTNVVRDGRVRP